MTIARQAEDMLMAAARCSEPGPGVTRLPFTDEHRAVLELLREWMTEAGLGVDMDAAGTLIGRTEGESRGAGAAGRVASGQRAPGRRL
jgi:allantoate deiminase